MIDPTRGVWRFQAGPWPVAVHWFFWLTMFLIALSYRELWVMVAFVGLAFVAVLTHEIGHQLVNRRYGADGHILLYGFGGLAFGTGGVPLRKRWLVSLGGPAMNLATGLPFWWFLRDPSRAAQLPFNVQIVMNLWVFVTVWWGLFNLLPILPLDGGNIFHNLSSQWKRRDTIRGAHLCSVITACIAGVALLWYENAGSGRFRIGPGFFFMVILAAMNFAALKGKDLINEESWEYVSAGADGDTGHRRGDGQRRSDVFRRTEGSGNVVDLNDARKKKAKVTTGDDIADALSALERHDGGRALDAIARARSQKVKSDQATMLDELEGWAYLAERKPVLAADVVARLPKKAVAVPYLQAGVALVGGEREQGIALLAAVILNGVEGHSKTLAIELVASEGITAEVAAGLLAAGGRGFESALKFQVALKKLGRSAHAAMVDDVILSGGA